MLNPEAVVQRCPENVLNFNLHFSNKGKTIEADLG